MVIEHVFIFVIAMIPSATSIFAVLIIGRKIIGYTVMNHMFVPVLQHAVPGLGMYGILCTVLVFTGMLMKMLTTKVLIEVLIFGTNIQRAVQNRTPRTPLKVIRESFLKKLTIKPGKKSSTTLVKSFTLPRETGVRIGFHGELN